MTSLEEEEDCSNRGGGEGGGEEGYSNRGGGGGGGGERELLAKQEKDDAKNEKTSKEEEEKEEDVPVEVVEIPGVVEGRSQRTRRGQSIGTELSTMKRLLGHFLGHQSRPQRQKMMSVK